MPRDIISKEVDHLSRLIPLKNESYVMFWRPQKVGSSTILSFLISYAYRYNLSSKRRGLPNSFCLKMMVCLSYSNYSKISVLRNDQQIHTAEAKLSHVYAETEPEKLLYTMSWSHQLCNLPAYLVSASLPCAFTKDYHYMQRNYKSNNKNKRKNNDNNLGQNLPFLPPSNNNMKELFVIRDPLSRMISIYYFWGELFRLKLSTSGVIIPRMAASIGKQIKNQWKPEGIGDNSNNNNSGDNKRNKKNKRNSNSNNNNDVDLVRIGNKIDKVEVIKGSFDYHGNESSPPDETIAMKFASRLPLKAGMPGPSYTWSAISNAYEDAVYELKTDRIMTILTERLDESLVVASHYLNWSLADMVVVKNRKALSTHPKHTEWPQSAIDIMKKSLVKAGEYAVYQAANEKLNERKNILKNKGIAIENQIQLLIYMRQKVSEICLSDSVMIVYRDFISNQGYGKHFSNNKLRDTEDSYVVGGHAFSYNGDLIHSYDVCGNCEAHALLYHIQQQLLLSSTPSTSSTGSTHSALSSINILTEQDIHRIKTTEYPRLFQMSDETRKNNVNFQNCPYNRNIN